MTDRETIAAVRKQVANGGTVANKDAKLLLRVAHDALEIVERGFVPEQDGRLLYRKSDVTTIASLDPRPRSVRR